MMLYDAILTKSHKFEKHLIMKKLKLFQKITMSSSEKGVLFILS